MNRTLPLRSAVRLPTLLFFAGLMFGAPLAAQTPTPKPTSKPAARATPAVSAADREAQQALWESVQQGNTIADYEAYLREYPKGIYAPLARSRKAGLEQKARAAAAAEQTFWQVTERGGKASDYEEYLRRFPAGGQVAAAKEKLARLDRGVSQQTVGSVYRDCPDCPEMVVLPAGDFEMGSKDGPPEERPLHSVTLPSFAIGKAEVTQAQWRAIMGSNPAFFNGCHECPIELVHWDDVQEYLKKLSAKTGHTYRLPTEAEWEYACRAGAQDDYCGGNAIETVGWYSANSGSIYYKKTRGIMGKRANGWGLFDMSGNVAEWVRDCWNPDYNGAPADGSARLAGDCERRVIRGGSWINSERYARAADRYYIRHDDRNRFIGFRVAQPLGGRP